MKFTRIIAVFLSLIFIVFCACGCAENQSSASDKTGSAYNASSKAESVTDDSVDMRNEYKMSVYEIFSGAKTEPDDYGNLTAYESIPYFSVLDEMFLDFYMSEDLLNPDIFNYEHMTNFRKARDNEDFYISDYKDGVCVNGYSGESRDVVIPETLDGKKVIKLGCNIVQEEFDTFYASPFYKNDLESVTLSSGIKEISYGALANITSSEDKICKRIYVDEDNPYYSSANGILYNKDKSILLQIPTDYEESAVDVEEGTKAVYSLGCSNKIKIVIPSSVVSFGETIDANGDSDACKASNSADNTFSGKNFNCPLRAIDVFNVSEFNVSDENLYYSSENGSLYNKDKTDVIISVE